MTTTDHRLPKLDQFTVWGALDNYNPHRLHFRGTMEVFKSHDGTSQKIWVLHADTTIMDKVENGSPPIFLLDDGETIIPLYVTGWKSDTREIYLRPIPTNPNGDKLDHRGEPIDYGTWKLGPRVAYHLKLQD